MNLDEIREYTRCVKDPLYCLDNFVWMDADNGIVQFNVGKEYGEDYFYQRQIIEKLSQGVPVACLKNRRAGLSWTGAFWAWYLANFRKGMNSLFVSIGEKEAKTLLLKPKFIHQNLYYKDDTNIENCRPAFFLKTPIETDSVQTFSFGHKNAAGEITARSAIQSLTTTKKTGRGEKAAFVFVDEAAFIENQDEVLSSVLTTTTRFGNWLIGCITEDSFIYTQNGVEQIGKYVTRKSPRGFSEIDEVDIFGLKGLKPSRKVYNSGFNKTIKIKTDYNYDLEMTKIHPILVNRNGNLNWVKAEDLIIGDWVPIARGMNIWGNQTLITDCFYTPKKLGSHKKFYLPNNMTDDLAYLLGLIVGDGYISHKTVVVSSIDFEIQQFLKDLGFTLEKDQINNRISSRDLVEFCKKFGMPVGRKAPDKFIPDRIMTSPKHIVASFLQGLFDTDGHSDSDGRIGLTSSSEIIINQVRALLLNFGIVSAKRPHNVPKRFVVDHWVKAGNHWRLTIGSDSGKFFNEIGFRLSRKQKNKANSYSSQNIIPFSRKLVKRLRKEIPYGELKNQKKYRGQSPHFRYSTLNDILNDLAEFEKLESYQNLKEIFDKNYLWVKIKSIKKYEAFTVDFNIPDGHSYIANGFVSHNSNAGPASSSFYNMCIAGRKKLERDRWVQLEDYFYREVWPDETGISEEMIRKSSVGLSKEHIDKEWNLQFIQSGSAVFNQKDLDVCYRPTFLYPEIEKTIKEYRQKVAEKPGEFYYFSAIDTIIGRTHRKSSEKDYNCFIALTKGGIQAFAYFDQKPLSQWAGEDTKGKDGWTSLEGKTSKLHRAYPGLCAIEDEGPGHTVVNRHRVPEDVMSEIRTMPMKHKTKSRLINQLQVAIESHQIVITDPETYNQLLIYQTGNIPGSYEAPAGQHDDAVMTLAMAWDNLLFEGGSDFEFSDTLEMLVPESRPQELQPLMTIPEGTRLIDNFLNEPFQRELKLANPDFLPSVTLMDKLRKHYERIRN